MPEQQPIAGNERRRWGLVLVLVSVAGASEADKKMGALVDGMRVGPLRRLDIGVTRKGTLIPAVVSSYGGWHPEFAQ